jgi:hypothetical protein
MAYIFHHLNFSSSSSYSAYGLTYIAHSPEVMLLAKSNDVFIISFPALTKHLLQPLYVGIYKSLKVHQSQGWNEYMKQNATEKTNNEFPPHIESNIHKYFLYQKYRECLQETGMFPFNRDQLPLEVLVPSQITKNPVPISLQHNLKC